MPLIRLAQRNASLKQRHMHQTSLIDHGYLTGHLGSIHPMDKTPVGKRLALSARQFAYQEDVVAVGLQPASASVFGQGGRLVLSFDPATVGPGGLLLRQSGPVRQVWLSGSNGMRALL